MEQLVYFLEHTASVSEQAFGILGFFIVYLGLPLLIEGAVAYIIIRLILALVNHLSRNNEAKQKSKYK